LQESRPGLGLEREGLPSLLVEPVAC